MRRTKNDKKNRREICISQRFFVIFKFYCHVCEAIVSYVTIEVLCVESREVEGIKARDELPYGAFNCVRTAYGIRLDVERHVRVV